MDVVYVAPTNAEEEPTDEDDKRAKKLRKMTPAQLKKFQAKLAEEVRLHLLRQRQEYLRDTKARIQSEWDTNRARAETYETEFRWRLGELEKAFKILSEIDDYWKEYQKGIKAEDDWQQYVAGGKLPNPCSIPDMNTYLFVWTELEKNAQMSHCMEKTEEVMKLLKDLEVVINYVGPEVTPKALQDMKELRCKIRDLLQDNIDRATFHLFSRIETDMVSVNVTTSKYSARCAYFMMSLWAELITPIPSTRGKEIRQPLKVSFEDIDVVVIVPVSLLDVHKVMRSMWLNYDHWSDKCRTYDCPPLPNYYRQNMLELFLTGNDAKLEIINYRDKLESTKKKKISALPPEPTLSQEILTWDSEPQKSLSEEVSFREFEEEDEMGRKVKNFLNEHEVNLRERSILGNLLLVNILYQPPQPKCLRYKHCVTLRQESSVLKEVDFYVKFAPAPEPDETKTTEDAIQSTKLNKRMMASKMDVLAEKKKLVVVQLKPCQTVVWFENPGVAHWNTVHGYWSTEDIYDVEVDEDDGTITFKSGRLGLFGLHVSRYVNLPYEEWLFEGDNDNGVNFYLKTPKVELFFKIREGEVCLDFARHTPNRALNPLFGVYHTPTKLMEVLKEKGLDVFPAPDAAAYLDLQSKHYVVEKTIYEVWGLFSRSHRFKWSKFNQFAGRGNIVFQAQEIYPGHQEERGNRTQDVPNEENNAAEDTKKAIQLNFNRFRLARDAPMREIGITAIPATASRVDYCLIQNSMCSSFVLDINEESRGYSPEPASDMLRAIELYGLLYNNSTLRARRLTEMTSFLLVATVKEFLGLVRPLSFS